MSKNKQERAPAQVVKCPHCNHIGSSRGLFTHIRLAHPGISDKPPISKRQHPYALGGVIDKVHRVDKKKSIKHKEESIETVLATVVIGAVIKAIDEYFKINQPLRGGGNASTQNPIKRVAY
jgi:hypothetical protein